VDINVNYADVTATGSSGGAGADFDNDTDPVTLTALDTTNKTVTVDITDDNIAELTETFAARLTTPTQFGTRLWDVSDTGTGTISDNDTNNDTATFTIDDVTVSEADGTATLTVSLDNPVDTAVVVDVYYASGTASAGADFDNTADQVTFAPFDTADKTVTVAITGDDIVELAETFTVSLSTAIPLGTRLTDLTDTATVTITDDDTATFTIDDVSVSEAAGTATFTVSLDNPVDTAVVVDVTYADVTASGGSGGVGADFDNDADQVTFSALGTANKSVTVAITNDNIVELTETYTASLGTATALGTRLSNLSDTGTGTITDNDTATFTINDVTVSETAGTLNFTVSLDNPVDIAVAVDVTFTDVSATGGGTDYTSTAQQVTFAANSNAAQTVGVPITNDNQLEPTETFTASLSTATALGTRSRDLSDTGTGTILDGDHMPATQPDTLTVPQGGTAGGNVSSNDTDPDLPHDTLTFGQVTQPSHGTVNFFNLDGTFSYTHDGSANFTDSFVYAAQDAGANSVQETVHITIQPVSDDTPLAVDDDVTVAEGGTATGNVMDNDLGLADAPVEATLGLEPSHGTVTLGSNGAFTYQHDDSEDPTDTFTYTITDADGQTDTGTVHVSVTPVNDNAPVTSDDSFTVPQGGTALRDPKLSIDDPDLPDDPFSFTVDTGPAHGTLELLPDGVFAYTHDGSSNLSGSFTYTVTDAAGHADTATMTITVIPGPPRVTGVRVSSTAWAGDFTAAVDPAQGIGYEIPSGADQLDPVPWVNLDTIHVTFSLEVGTVSPGDVELRGVAVANYVLGPISYDAGTFTAHIPLAAANQPIGSDKLRLVVKDTVTGPSGAALDGEWIDGTSIQSGDAVAGGDFAFRFNVLPADVDQDGEVLANDAAIVMSQQLTSPGDATYSILSDLDGSAFTFANDTAQVWQRQMGVLPTGSPASLMLGVRDAALSQWTPPGGPRLVGGTAPTETSAAVVDDAFRTL
jgi:VCBS repeat-containing protein